MVQGRIPLLGAVFIYHLIPGQVLPYHRDRNALGMEPLLLVTGIYLLNKEQNHIHLCLPD